MGWVSVEDVFAHIADELRVNANLSPSHSMEEYLAGCAFDLHVSITDNVEETELFYLERYGNGHTFYFRLADYEHGKILAGQIYWIMLGKRPDLDLYTGGKFGEGARLYLFVHVRSIKPAALS